MQRLLQLRRKMPAVFRDGGYEPLPVKGQYADHVIAFRRGDDLAGAAVIVGRHFTKLLDDAACWDTQNWGETSVNLQTGAGTDIFTGRAARGEVLMRNAFSRLPVAVIAWGVQPRTPDA